MMQERGQTRHPQQVSAAAHYQTQWTLNDSIETQAQNRVDEATRKEQREVEQLNYLIGSRRRGIREKIIEHFMSSKLNDPEHYNSSAHEYIEHYWEVLDQCVEFTTIATHIEAQTRRVREIVRSMSRFNQDMLFAAYHRGAWHELSYLAHEGNRPDTATDDDRVASTIRDFQERQADYDQYGDENEGDNEQEPPFQEEDDEERQVEVHDLTNE